MYIYKNIYIYIYLSLYLSIFLSIFHLSLSLYIYIYIYGGGGGGRWGGGYHPLQPPEIGSPRDLSLSFWFSMFGGISTQPSSRDFFTGNVVETLVGKMSLYRAMLVAKYQEHARTDLRSPLRVRIPSLSHMPHAWSICERDHPCGLNLYLGNTGTVACSTHAPFLWPGTMTLCGMQPTPQRSTLCDQHAGDLRTESIQTDAL